MLKAREITWKVFGKYNALIGHSGKHHVATYCHREDVSPSRCWRLDFHLTNHTHHSATEEHCRSLAQHLLDQFLAEAPIRVGGGRP